MSLGGYDSKERESSQDAYRRSAVPGVHPQPHPAMSARQSSKPFIERTSQRPLRALCATAHVERQATSLRRPVSSSSYLYRIMPFRHLVNLLETREFYFASPHTLDDPYERVLSAQGKFVRLCSVLVQAFRF